MFHWPNMIIYLVTTNCQNKSFPSVVMLMRKTNQYAKTCRQPMEVMYRGSVLPLGTRLALFMNSYKQRQVKTLMGIKQLEVSGVK